MQVSEAASLIQLNRSESTSSEIWADLGCGSGTFTYALASKLVTGSSVYAMDKEHQSLQETYGEVQISFIHANFISGVNMLPLLDGALMANSLHYVEDKLHYLQSLKSRMKPGSEWIIVEYDINKPNTWVPFPIDYNALKVLMAQVGVHLIEQVGEHDSRFENKMYVAKITL